MSDDNTQAFKVINCSFASVATGVHAGSLLELHDKLLTIDEGVIYHHFWGGLMYPKFTHPQHHNDFSRWAYYRLNDHILAERLNIIDPTEFDTLESLRQGLLETVEERMDETESIIWTKREDRFYFVNSTMITFNSTFSIAKPEDFHEILKKLPPGCIFYHFIDARRRTPERIDDFSSWLKTFGESYQPLIQQIEEIDSFFLSLTDIRNRLTEVSHQFFNEKGGKHG